MSINSIHTPELTPELTPEMPTQTLIDILCKQLHYMPFPGAQGALYLDGNHATDFLQRYEILFRELEENEAIAVKSSRCTALVRLG